MYRNCYKVFQKHLVVSIPQSQIYFRTVRIGLRSSEVKSNEEKKHKNELRSSASHNYTSEDFFGINKSKADSQNETKLNDTDIKGKYSDLLQPKREEADEYQKYIVMNFGTVRFDTDNIPIYHGQFENNEESQRDFAEVSTESQRKTLNRQEKNSEQYVLKNTKLNSNGFVGTGNNKQHSGYTIQEDAANINSGSSSSPESDTRNVDKQYFLNISNECEEFGPYSSSDFYEMNRSKQAHATSKTDQNIQEIDKEYQEVKNPETRETCFNSYSEKEYLDDKNHALNFKLSNNPPSDKFTDNDRTSRNYGESSKSGNKDSLRAKDSGSMPNIESDPTSRKFQEHKASTEANTQSDEQQHSSDKVSGYDYIRNKRQQRNIQSETSSGTVEAHKAMRNLIQDLRYLPEEVVLHLLKSSIIYNQSEIVAFNKPYGIASHGPESKIIGRSMSTFLPRLAKELKFDDPDGKLYPVHRLDRDTTGVLLYARTQEMAKRLSEMFKERKIEKVYWAITKGVPSPLEGIIDIPIMEGHVNEKERMVLLPELSKDLKPLYPLKGDASQAITYYKTLDYKGNAALLHIKPQTGVKHQIRVHMSFALRCAVLGDHKYSHFTKMAPQRLPDDILSRLKLKQSKARYVPMHLHAKALVIPEICEGKNIIIKAELPVHFLKHMKVLGLHIK